MGDQSSPINYIFNFIIFNLKLKDYKIKNDIFI